MADHVWGENGYQLQRSYVEIIENKDKAIEIISSYILWSNCVLLVIT